MKALFFTWLAAAGCLVCVVHAQELATAPAPPPLPPPPWLKRAPEFSQWEIGFTRTDQQPKTAKQSAPGAEKKSIQTTKTQDIVLETTTRANGAVIQQYHLHGVILTQVDRTGGWISASNIGDNGFNEADYLKSDFAGFGWISDKNYAGVQTLNNHKCLMFQDKVVTLDQQDLKALRQSMTQAVNDWEAEQLRGSAGARTPTAGPSPGSKASAQTSPAPTAKPKVSAPRPPNFNIEDYKTPATAFIDIDSGMPVALTYKTLQGVQETRSYIFQEPPTAPLVLPPDVQALVSLNKAVLRRMTSRGAIP